MKRSYHPVLLNNLRRQRQMAFVCGPRQVGKTTLCTGLSPGAPYLNWDNQDHRAVLVGGPRAVAEELGLDRLRAEPPLSVFDEIHKYPKWKDFLKGFYDVYGDKVRVCVTGSSRLDLFQRGGDSLLGRYFLYRLHPMSLREWIAPELEDREIQEPARVEKDRMESLLTLGGFPEPLEEGTKRFHNRWQRMRTRLIFREDIRDLTSIQEVGQLELLADLLVMQSGGLVNYSRLSQRVRVSVDTVRRWIQALGALYYVFTVPPWTKNVSRSLLKQPKVYLWDWSQVRDPGQRVENLVASHLHKAVQWWTDNGYGEYGLYFVRDKDKREVDFLVAKNGKPWFLVEARAGKGRMNPALARFQEQTGAAHAFQAVMDLEPVDADCFSRREPVMVPMTTLLSQLV